MIDEIWTRWLNDLFYNNFNNFDNLNNFTNLNNIYNPFEKVKEEVSDLFKNKDIPDESDVKDPMLILPSLENNRASRNGPAGWCIHVLAQTNNNPGGIKWRKLEEAYLKMIKDGLHLNPKLKNEFIYSASYCGLEALREKNGIEQPEEQKKRIKTYKELFDLLDKSSTIDKKTFENLKNLQQQKPKLK